MRKALRTWSDRLHDRVQGAAPYPLTSMEPTATGRIMPSARHKILMLIPNLDMGGAQKVFFDHSRLLAERYDVEEAVFNLADGHAFPSGQPLHDLGVPGGGGLFDKATNLWRRVEALRRVKAQVRPALCISHMPGADYVNILSRGSDRTIAVVHGSKSSDPASVPMLARLQSRLLQPFIHRRADAVVTVSRDLIEDIAELGVDRKRIRVINNFFEHDCIREATRQALTPDEQQLFADRQVIVTTGRLAEQKNHAGLLAVFARLLASRPARLLILGDGPLRSALTIRAEALGLSWWAAWSGEALVPGRDVYFLGAQQKPFRWYGHCDLFVLSSGWEGFPLALGEAMICGLPVASTDCPTGPREILAPATNAPAERIAHAEEGEWGMLLPLLNLPETADHAKKVWAEAIAALLGDERLKRRGEAAATRMEAFTRERIGNQWFALVDELIGGLPAGHRRSR